jgi:hypothetical protein
MDFGIATPLKNEATILREIEERTAKIQQLVSDKVGPDIPIPEIKALAENQSPEVPGSTKKLFVLDEVTLLKTELLAAKRQGLEAELRYIQLKAQELGRRKQILEGEQTELLQAIAQQAGFQGPIIVKFAAHLKRGWVEISQVPTNPSMAL